MLRGTWILIALAACDGPADDPPPAAPHELPRIGDGEIDVIVNGDKLLMLSREQLRGGVRLDEALPNHPYVGWSSITAYGPGVGPLQWLDPVTNHAGRVPLVYRDGDRGAIALVDPDHLDVRDERFTNIDEIVIAIPKPRRSPLESLAKGCRPPPKSELPEPATAKKWRGSSYQFNIPVHWNSELTIDFDALVASPVGARVGTIVGSAVEWEQVCHATLYRIADRNGRRAVVGKVWPNETCVDAIMEFACDGTTMNEWAYYADSGQYVEHGTIAPAP